MSGRWKFPTSEERKNNQVHGQNGIPRMLHCFLIIAFAFLSASISVAPLFRYCNMSSSYNFLARSSVNSLYFLPSWMAGSPAPFSSMYSCLHASHESSKNSVWTGHRVLHHRIFGDLQAAVRGDLDTHYRQDRPCVFQSFPLVDVLCHL